MSAGDPLSCPLCLVPLPVALFKRPDKSECPSCGKTLRAFVFPAAYEAPKEGAAAEAVLDDESSCFYHPTKKAVTVCSSCGRFLCSLCDIDMTGGHFCSRCIETGKKKGEMKNLETRRLLYDEIALSLAIVPMLFLFITIFTAPMSIYIALRHWKKPLSITGRSRIRFIIALLISTTQLVGWAYLALEALI